MKVDSSLTVSTFDKFGKSVRAVVMVDETGKGRPRGFEFASFDTHHAKAKAVEALNGSIINGGRIYCDRAEKKEEGTTDAIDVRAQKLYNTWRQGSISLVDYFSGRQLWSSEVTFGRWHPINLAGGE